jgi:glutathione S-transferase
MILIGKLDSPYVRRVAIAMKVLGLSFEHRDLSVFTDFDAFASLNPAVKAPTLIAQGGVVLIESTLIMSYLRELSGTHDFWRPLSETKLLDLRLTGLALLACDKTVQLVYEQMRTPDKRDLAWTNRVRQQLVAAYDLLEADLAKPRDGAPFPNETFVTIAVAWRFSRYAAADEVEGPKYPRLFALSDCAERLDAFLSMPLY